MNKTLDISVIIVNWNTKALLLSSLESVFETMKDLSFEVFIIDNASSDGSIQALEELQKKYFNLKIIKNSQNLGFAKANNIAFKIINGKYALLLNTDAKLTKQAVYKLFDFMEKNPKTAITCGQLLNLNGSKQNSFANFPSVMTLLFNEIFLSFLLPKKFSHKRINYTCPIKVDSGIGACILIRKQALDNAGFFDERYFFFLEETDLAYQMAKLGWDIYFIPDAKIFHAQGQSVGHNINSRIIYYESFYKYFKKWHEKFYLFYFILIFARLCANALLSLIGVIFTFGLNFSLNKKFLVYLKLIFWHFSKFKQKILDNFR